MKTANSYENILQNLHYSRTGAIWMCALLFAPPTTEAGKSIMDRLDYWHHRSGDHFDFFCVGYVDHNEFADDKPVGRLVERDGRGARQFYFSARAFNDIRDEIMRRSSWRYSGEADLLLVNAVRRGVSSGAPERSLNPYGHPSLALDELVALDLDLLVRDGVYESPARLMESICRAADLAAEKGQALEVNRYSDAQFVRTFLRKSVESVVGFLKLDKPLAARHFLVGGHLLH